MQTEPLDCVIPAWSAGIQVDMDVSGGILANLMPAIRAGMTKISIFMLCGQRKIMEHFGDHFNNRIKEGIENEH